MALHSKRRSGAEEIASRATQRRVMLDPGAQEFPDTRDFDEKTAIARSPEMIRISRP
jgi:hypothetical protein